MSKSSPQDVGLAQGLPASIDAERFVLGSVLLDGSRFVDVVPNLSVDDFTLEKHRRIYKRMLELYAAGEAIDRVTVANQLLRFNELESVDGLSYLVSLDDGLPHIANLDSYIGLVKEKSALRRITMKAQHLLNRALIGQESANEILDSFQSDLLDLRTGDDRKGFISAGDFIRGFEGGMNALFASSQRDAGGVRSGFTKLDNMLRGWQPGELIILAARPSMGKTSFCLNCAWHAAVHDSKPVAISSLEMSIQSLLLRMICGAARVDTHRVLSGRLSPAEMDRLRIAAMECAEAPIYLDDTSSVTAADIRSKSLRLQQQIGQIGMVVVDYLQLMGGQSRGRESRNQEVGDISRSLKLLAKELHCPVMALSQLSRKCEERPGDHRPQLSDLRDSGNLEQDADIVGFIFREEVYKRDREDLRGLAELIIAKDRNGPIGTVDLVFLHNLTKFESRAEDSYIDESSRFPN